MEINNRAGRRQLVHFELHTSTSVELSTPLSFILCDILDSLGMFLVYSYKLELPGKLIMPTVGERRFLPYILVPRLHSNRAVRV